MNQENQLKSPSIQVNKDAYNKDEILSDDYFEWTNIQDDNIGLRLQVLRGGTHPNGVGSELIFLLESLCYRWFRLQLITIHCNRPGV